MQECFPASDAADRFCGGASAKDGEVGDNNQALEGEAECDAVKGCRQPEDVGRAEWRGNGECCGAGSCYDR